MEKTTNKMTKAVAFGIALEVMEQSTHPQKSEVIEKIAKEIENLGKKSGSGKPTKAQEANAVLAHQMLDWMEAEKAYTIAELSKECPAVMGMTPQKIRPLLSSLIKDNAVERSEVKGKPVFTKVAEVEAEA